MTVSRRNALLLSLSAVAGVIAMPSSALSFEAKLIRVKRRPEAPVFTLRAPDGSIHSLKDYRGKVVLLNFWATWCPPCRREMPSIEALWRGVKELGVIVLGVHVGPSMEAARVYAQRSGLTFPVLVDDTKEVSYHYGVRSMPTTVIVGPEGHVEYVAFGPRDWNSEDTRRVLLSLRHRSVPEKT